MRRLSIVALLLVSLPLGASAQVSNDFVVTLGGAWEAYSGNFPAVTLAVVDSTNSAAAAVGEFRARGRRTIYLDDDRSVVIGFEGGLRQFAAMGFQVRDYAPREWASQLSASYSQSINTLGRLTVMGSYRGRAVEDRPPMPLFLQPGYGNARGSARFRFAPIQGVSFDAQADLEHTNYEAPRLLSYLDLLDRNSQGVEVGALTGGDRDWNVRFFSGLRWSQFENQARRRDKAINLGAQWMMSPMDGGLEASLGVEGTLNRSNSLRPQYDALSVTGDLFTPLPWLGLSASASALLTWKAYVQDIPYARLVPGEEADNASIVYFELLRPLAANLNAQLRFAWARAETDIGNSYYNRFGTTLLFNFRPGG